MVIGQTDSLSQPKRKAIAVLPVVFYTPETGLAFGGAGIGTFRFKNLVPGGRPSQIQLGVGYTLKKQLLSYLPFKVFTPDQSYYFFGELGYYRYIYAYYGVGNDLKEENEENYSVNYPRVRLNVLKQIRPNLYAGVRYWFNDYKISKRKENGLLVQDEVVGSDGSVVSTLGMVGVYDNRDLLFYPSKGWYIESSVTFSSSFLLASNDYQRVSIDIVKYQALKKNLILATNLWMDFTFGDVPFQELAFIGGPKKMRGYIEGRYREQKLLLLQTELRFPLFWRIGGVAFAGTGQVQKNFNDFRGSDFHYTYGAGIRFRINDQDKVNIRLDVGVDENGNVLPYLTFNEAF